MRWFTLEWATGGLSEEEVEQAEIDYKSHADGIVNELPSEMRAFLGHGAAISLHDATFIDVQQSPGNADELIVDLATLDYANGTLHENKYWKHPNLHVRIVYSGAELLSPRDFSKFEQMVLRRKAEILYTELDRAEGGNFEHRMLLFPWKLPHFAVRFSHATVRVVRLDGTSVEVLPLIN